MSKYKSPWKEYCMNKEFWEEVLKGRKIEEVIWDDEGVAGLKLDSGELVHLTGKTGRIYIKDDIDTLPKHYPAGMGEESRRLHREYNREYNELVRSQSAGAKNGAEVRKLTDECNAKGIILIPGGENL